MNMKPLNRDERWYVYVWLLNQFDGTKLFRDSKYSIVAAGKKIRHDPKRHNELQRYSDYLIDETPR